LGRLISENAGRRQVGPAPEAQAPEPFHGKRQFHGHGKKDHGVAQLFSGVPFSSEVPLLGKRQFHQAAAGGGSQTPSYQLLGHDYAAPVGGFGGRAVKGHGVGAMERDFGRRGGSTQMGALLQFR